VYYPPTRINGIRVAEIHHVSAKVLAGVLADEFVPTGFWMWSGAVDIRNRTFFERQHGKKFSRAVPSDPIASGENANGGRAGDPLETDLLGGIATERNRAVSAATGVLTWIYSPPRPLFFFSPAVARPGAATLARRLPSRSRRESVDPSPSTARTRRN